MRIVYVHQHFSTPKGSTAIRSYQMARRLIERGHNVLVVCGSEERASTGLTAPFTNGRRRGFVDGIEVVEFDLAYSNTDGFLQRILTFLRYVVSSSRILMSEPFDLLFATTPPLTTGITGITVSTLRRKPFVFEVRDLWPEFPRAMGIIRNPLVLWGLTLLERASYRAAKRLIGLSPGIVDGIARTGVERSRIALIPNGCDLEIFAKDTAPWRPQGVLPDDLMAIFAGTHGLANGLDAVIDAAIELTQRRRLDIKIVLIGSGNMKAHLQQRALSASLTNVVFLEPVEKTVLASLLRASNVGLQVLADVPAFYYGTSPNKFFDYLAAGLPVVVNYPGWLAELIEAHDCGYATPRQGGLGIAEALLHAADHRQLLPAMGLRAQRLARQFDRNELATQFATWLEGAAAV